jgi:hypothetical protein
VGPQVHDKSSHPDHFYPKTTAGYAYFQTKHRREVLTQHPNKVLSCVPQAARVGAEPERISAEQLLRTTTSAPDDAQFPAAMISGGQFFKRER